MLLLLALACGDPPPAPEAPAPTEPAATVAAGPPPPFTCADAAAALERPQARVAACSSLPNLPEVFQVALHDPADAATAQTLAVLVRDGRPQVATGPAGLFAFVDGLPAERRAALTMADINGLLRAFDAFPEGFGARDWNFDMPGIGRSSFTPEPWRLVLYRTEPPPPSDPAGPARHHRATLTRAPWAWLLETRQPDGAWAPAAAP